jgi:uncharacterized protein YceH (UPF0502 family)
MTDEQEDIFYLEDRVADLEAEVFELREIVERLLSVRKGRGE